MFENLRVLFRGTQQSESKLDGSHEAIVEAAESMPVAYAHATWAQAAFDLAHDPGNTALQAQVAQAEAERIAASNEYRQALLGAGRIQAS